MKKLFGWFLGISLLAGAFGPALPPALADVEVNVNIGAPVVVTDDPDELIFMPGYGVYFVYGIGYDIFFYNGFWWSRRGNVWYRSRNYRVGWAVIGVNDVPRAVFRVPADYRARFGRGPRIKYRDWKARRGGPVGGPGMGRGPERPERGHGGGFGGGRGRGRR